MLISLGFIINFSVSAISDISTISYFGLLVPWLIYLIIPVYMKLKKINLEILWLYYYRFMLWSNILGILDYILYLNSTSLRVLETQYGTFLGANFSIFHMISNEYGVAHFRYYSCFIEPGNLAMMLLPAIAYAIYFKKYFSLLIFLPAFYLTFSLGGNISLALLFFLMLSKKFIKNKLYLVVFPLFASFFIIIFFSLTFDSFKDSYDSRGESAEVREQNLINGLKNIPKIIINHPLGLKLKNKTSEIEEKNDLFVGTNFSPLSFLQNGGILSFIGFISILIISFFICLVHFIKFKLSKIERVAYISLLVIFPFIFQRTTIFEIATYSFLYCPLIITYINEKINFKR